MSEFKKLIERAEAAMKSAPSGMEEITYKVVLTHLLGSGRIDSGKLNESQSTLAESGNKKVGPTADTASFFQRFSIEQKDWETVFMEHEGASEIIVRRLPGKTKSTKHVGLALLLGVANLKDIGKSDFSSIELSELCKNHSCYNNDMLGSLKRTDFFMYLTENLKLTKPGEYAAIKLIGEIAASKKGGQSSGS